MTVVTIFLMLRPMYDTSSGPSSTFDPTPFWSSGGVACCSEEGVACLALAANTEGTLLMTARGVALGRRVGGVLGFDQFWH